jgi:hypothetical protein
MMQWVKVELPIPEVIVDLYDQIARLNRYTCIAGGFLCDLHMGTPFKDVDFFLRDSFNDDKEKIKNLMLSLSAIEEHTTRLPTDKEGYDDLFQISLQTYSYLGYRIQLVWTKDGIRSVKSFDARFREFIYVKGIALASKEALSDIASKQIVFGTYRAPLRSICRAISFANRYGFSIDTLSYDRLVTRYNRTNWDREIKAIDYLRSYPDPFVYQQLHDQFNKNEELQLRADPLSRYQYWALEQAIAYHLNRDQLDALFEKESLHIPEQRITYTIPEEENPLETAFLAAGMALGKTIRRIRLSLVFELEGKMLNEVIDAANDLAEGKRLFVHFGFFAGLVGQPWARALEEFELFIEMGKSYNHLFDLEIFHSRSPYYTHIDAHIRHTRRKNFLSFLVKTKNGAGVVGFCFDEATKTLLKQGSFEICYEGEVTTYLRDQIKQLFPDIFAPVGHTTH